MNDNKENEIIMEEVKKMYDDYFKEIENNPAKDEIESNKISKQFYNEVQEYIKKRKKELKIDTQ